MFELPEGYKEIEKIDFKKDKKLSLFINVAALILILILFFAGLIFNRYFYLNYASFFIVIISGILYIIGHELIHGVFIRIYSGKKPKIGFTLMYAYAGSDAYFNKKQYVIIALAPVVFFGIIFLLLNIFLPSEWFWTIYLLQIFNLSGAAGDFYMTNLMTKLPADVLVHDSGTAMNIYYRT